MGNLMRQFVVLLALISLAGCATNFEPKPLAADHPASAQAREAPRSRTSRLIVTDELSRKTEMQLARKDVPNPDFQGSGMPHDMSKMPGMDHSKMPGMDMKKQPATSPAQEPAKKMPGMDHSKMKETPMPAASVTASPADKEAVEGEMKKTSDEMKKLSDEMKAKSDAAKSDKRKSAASESTPAAAVYTCTMHPEVNLPAPGKCPKCGMTLVKKESGAK
jgi:uncharacterized protein involved in copper resistance